MRIKETLVGVVVAALGGATAVFSNATLGTVVTTIGAVLIVWHGLSEEPTAK